MLHATRFPPFWYAHGTRLHSLNPQRRAETVSFSGDYVACRDPKIPEGSLFSSRGSPLSSTQLIVA